MHLSAKFRRDMLWAFFRAVIFATSDFIIPRLLAAAVDMEPQDFQQLMFDVSGHPRHASMLQACRNKGRVPESLQFEPTHHPSTTTLWLPNPCVDAMDRGGLQLSIAVTTSFETHGAANCLEGWRWWRDV